MSLSLGTPVLEVAIALSFVFFLLSLIVSAGTEVLAWASKKRAKNLKEGVKALLGDHEAPGEERGLADRVLDHPLVKSDVRGSPKHQPSYVSARNFALALVQQLRESGGTAKKDFNRVKNAIETMQGPAGEQLKALLAGGEQDLAGFQASLETWFDDAMDRVSGWYKRWSQKWMIAIAILAAIGLNVSAIRVVERLYSQPAVRAAVVATAEKTAEGSGPQASDEATPKEAGDQVETAYTELHELKLPLFWSQENVPWASWKQAGLSALGWLITIAAISLGAPFWFDALKKLSNLRMAGKKPEAEPEKQ